jgi:cytochrome c553
MRKLLKILGWLIGGLVAAIAVAAVAVYFGSNSTLKKPYVVSVAPVAIPTDVVAIARGKHLAHTRGCVDCHGQDFGGARVIEDGAMGTLHGSNLTRGRGGRVANFTDADWVRAIRHGVGPDQRGLFIMPSEEYSHLSDSDLGALIAYLKNVPAVDRERVPTSLGPVSRVLLATGKMQLAAAVIDHPNVRPPAVTPGITVEYGRYVAASCMGCHGSNFSGGKIEVGPPSWPHAANLTPHADGRMAKWSEEDFLKVMRTGKRPDGSELNAVMPRAFGQMDDTELKALWAFFRSLPGAATGTR